MKISEMIELLHDIQKEHGDLPVFSGYDDNPTSTLLVLNDQGCETAVYGGKGVEVYIE